MKATFLLCDSLADGSDILRLRCICAVWCGVAECGGVRLSVACVASVASVASVAECSECGECSEGG